MPDGSLAVTVSSGAVVSYDPAAKTSQTLAKGFDELMGVAAGGNAAVLVAEAGGGRVWRIGRGGRELLAEGLARPIGVAIDRSGAPLVTESGRGRLLRLGREPQVVAEGLGRPEGLAVSGNRAIIADTSGRRIIAVNLASGAVAELARNAPVGPPPGIEPKPLRGIPGFMAGPLTPFCGLTTNNTGQVFVSANGEGSVLRIDIRD